MIGSNELEQGQVIIREVATREEVKVERSQMVQEVKNRLGLPLVDS